MFILLCIMRCITVYYEVHNNIQEALMREKQIKKWNRKWKVRLIKEMNSEWKDLYNDIV
jgi:putative endonuclease